MPQFSAPRLGLNQYKEKPSLLALSLQLRTLLPSLKLVGTTQLFESFHLD